MDAFSSVANLTFSEGILQENLISFGLLLDLMIIGRSRVLGIAVPPDVAGSNIGSYGWSIGLTTVNREIYSSNGQSNRSDIFSPGNLFITLSMHELGHSLGFAHPHDNSGDFLE